MNENFIAKVSIAIKASRHAVWQALISPDAIKEYMFGARVDSDWREGSPISWKGEWQNITNATKAARVHSENNWKMMLDGLKKYLESEPEPNGATR
jgi:uncharacterized protein YndB with AHSA1/START domain